MQGLVAERVVISAPLDPFLTLKALADYSGISVRKLREYLEDPVHPLPHYRVGGKVLVRRSEFDAWMAHFRRVGRAEVDQIVAEVLDGLG
jgi:excisionase family DNA binding protein